MNCKCKLCESHDSNTVEVIDAKSRQKLVIALCKICGLVQQSIIPTDEELRIYYSHNYRKDYKNTYSPKLKYVRRAGIAAKNRIEFLKSCIEPAGKKLLDIGAGGGEFVYLASAAGFHASGVEPNEGYSEFAKREYGAEIETMMLDQLQSASADVITLFHVFEHMAKPKEVMQKISEVLHNDGILFIEVPNILQCDASPHNIYFKAHLFYYSKFTLISAASKYFEPIKVDDEGNLKIIFRKKSNPLSHESFPTKTDVDFSRQRIGQKGWLEYLFQGGGIFKPFKRAKQILIEENLNRNITPKDLLDNL